MEHADGSHLLAQLDRDDFLRVVRRAEAASEEADATTQTLRQWAERLLPYLEAHPAWTIDQAVERYRADTAKAADRA